MSGYIGSEVDRLKEIINQLDGRCTAALKERNARFTRDQVVRAMEIAADPDVTWDAEAEREEVFAGILAEVKGE